MYLCISTVVDFNSQNFDPPPNEIWQIQLCRCFILWLWTQIYVIDVKTSLSFYLPNNTTAHTFASIQFYKSRTARSDKNTNSCLKTCNKTVTGYIFYHTSKILQTRKLQKSIFSMLFLKTFKDAKFTVDGSAFQTFNTLSTKNFCPMLAVHLGLNSLYLWL